MSKNVGSFWRTAGYNYLQYLSICSNAIRGSLKEPLKSRAMTRSSLFYNKTTPKNTAKGK